MTLETLRTNIDFFSIYEYGVPLLQFFSNDFLIVQMAVVSYALREYENILKSQKKIHYKLESGRMRTSFALKLYTRRYIDEIKFIASKA